MSPLARYNRLIALRNRKVNEGIRLDLWSDYGHELKGIKKPTVLAIGLI
jgi:hypothetical protein